MVDRMRAKKNDRIVYLTPAAWYLAEGGVKAMDSMFADVPTFGKNHTFAA